MKKIIVLIFLVIAHTALYGQSLFQTVPDSFPLSDRDRYEYAWLEGGFSRYPFISCWSREGIDHHADYSVMNMRTGVRYDPFVVSASVAKPSLDLYTNNLDAIDDFFRLKDESAAYTAILESYLDPVYLMAGFVYRDGCGGMFGTGANLPRGRLLFLFSYIPSVYRFRYSVNGVGGEVLFGHRDYKFTGCYDSTSFHSEIFCSVITPYKDERKIHSINKGYYAGGNVSSKGEHFILEAGYQYAKVNISLYDEVSPFGRLDDGQYHTYTASGGWVFNKYCTVTGGVMGLNASAERGSYFEIWPFSFWDMILPPRLKLDALDINLVLPNAGVTGSYPFMIKKLAVCPSLTVGYYHLLLSDTIKYSKKKWDVYPFVPHYEKERINIEPGYYGIVNLKADLKLEMAHVDFKFSISQLAPAGKKKKKKSNIDPDLEKDSGPFIVISAMGYL